MTDIGEVEIAALYAAAVLLSWRVSPPINGFPWFSVLFYSSIGAYAYFAGAGFLNTFSYMLISQAVGRLGKRRWGKVLVVIAVIYLELLFDPAHLAPWSFISAVALLGLGAPWIAKWIAHDGDSAGPGAEARGSA